MKRFYFVLFFAMLIIPSSGQSSPSSTETIKMQTGSGSARTAIGYSSENGLDFTNVNDVKAWIATGYMEDGTVLLTRVKIVPPNTGLFLTTTNAGVELSVPTTSSDFYYANLLLPIITKQTITPIETIDDVEYQNFAVGTLNNGQMGFVTVTSNIQIGPNKSRLRVPSRYYTPTAQTRGGMQLEFIDDVSTGLRQMPISENADAIFDLQGRKVHNPVRGLYIKNGKKVIIR